MPQWYVTGRGWLDEFGRSGKPKHRNYAWIWPNDRNRSTWGRLTDIFTNKGPDMFIAMNPNRRAGVSDGPSRKRWTNCADEEWDARQRNLDAANYKGTVGPCSTRKPWQKYDFRTRRYRHGYPGMWADIQQYPGTNDPSAISWWPHYYTFEPQRPNGATAYTDPKNFGQNTVLDGQPFGGGGYWHPQTDGMPLDQ